MKKHMVLCLSSIAMVFTVMSSEGFSATFAYVPNSGDATVSIISTESAEVVDTVGVGNGPWGVAMVPMGEYVYITNYTDGTVSAIDTLDNSVSDTIDVGNGPTGIAAGPNGDYVYVANFLDNTLSIIDLAINSVTATINVGNGPTGVAVDPRGDYAYVTNYLDDTVSVIYTSDAIISETFDVGDGPHGITLSASGAYVYIVNNLEDNLSVITTSYTSSSANHEVGDEPMGVAVASVVNNLYITNNFDNTVTVISEDDYSILSTINVGIGPQGVAATPNGEQVYVVNNLDDTVSVINTADNTVSSTISVGHAPSAFGAFIGGRPPAAPSDLVVEAVSSDHIDIAWVDNSNNELGFHIERKKGTYDAYSLIATVDPNVTSFSDSELNQYRLYYYRVASYNDAGYSYYSNETSATTEKSESSTCFIATAAFGSGMDPHVQILKDFRDTFLLTNKLGKSFVELYYTYSPPLARFIAKHEILRTAVRRGLTPFIGLSWTALTFGLTPTIMFIHIIPPLVGISFLVFSRKKPRHGHHK